MAFYIRLSTIILIISVHIVSIILQNLLIFMSKFLLIVSFMVERTVMFVRVAVLLAKKETASALHAKSAIAGCTKFFFTLPTFLLILLKQSGG